MTRVTLIAFTLFTLIGCGRYYAGGAPVRPAPEPTPFAGGEGRNTTLIVFGAGFCGDCKVDFPKVNEGIAALPEPLRQKLEVKLFYVSGDPGLVRPTPDAALAYKEAHFVLATPFADLPWMWSNFKSLNPGVPLRVPHAVVLDEEQKVVKRYTSGKTSFVPSEIVAFVESRLRGK